VLSPDKIIFLLRFMICRKYILAEIVMLLFVIAGLTASCKDKPDSSSPFPSVLSVKITPEDPSTIHDLNIIMEGMEGSDLTFKYVWKRNGEEIFGETFNSLRPLNFSKHDTISVVVTPLQGELVGKSVESSPVVIMNTDPKISSATIQPQPAYTNIELEASIEASDDDDDYLVYSYQWIKNGQKIADETSSVLSSLVFERGDKIECSIVPSDQESEGNEFTTRPVVIINRPPSITSPPPTDIVLEGSLTYQVVVEDPDQDTLAFSLSSSVPEGITVDPATGVIKWEIPKGLAGVYPIEIIVSDGQGGRCSQNFNLTISENRE
jgi:hypothetical protein